MFPAVNLWNRNAWPKTSVKAPPDLHGCPAGRREQAAGKHRHIVVLRHQDHGKNVPTARGRHRQARVRRGNQRINGRTRFAGCHRRLKKADVKTHVRRIGYDKFAGLAVCPGTGFVQPPVESVRRGARYLSDRHIDITYPPSTKAMCRTNLLAYVYNFEASPAAHRLSRTSMTSLRWPVRP